MKNRAIFFALLLCAVFHQTAPSQEPAFEWATCMGVSSGYDYGIAVVTDAAGNVYSCGSFTGRVDFDPGPDTFYLVSEGMEDIYIQKLDAAGNFIWVKQTGGQDYDYSSSLVSDAAGNLYCAGEFRDIVDFDPGPGTVNLIAGGFHQTTFIQKLNPAGELV